MYEALTFAVVFATLVVMILDFMESVSLFGQFSDYFYNLVN